MANIGQKLAEVPVAKMIESLALGIARAQGALDESSVKTLQAFNKETITIHGAKKTLLECGLLPSFYFFSEATLELHISMSMRSEESQTVGGAANVSAQSGSASFGASVNFENSRKFEFSAQGSTAVTVRIVTIPPPAQLLELIQGP